MTEQNAALPKGKQTVLGLYVTAKEAYEMWKAAPEKVTIIDVRTPDEYLFIGHPTMAWNIPVAVQTYEWDAVKGGFSHEAPGRLRLPGELGGQALPLRPRPRPPVPPHGQSRVARRNGHVRGRQARPLDDVRGIPRNGYKMVRKGPSIFGTLAGLVAFALAVTAPAVAQSPEELAKKLANPVASLISFPLQNNFDLNYRGAQIDGGYKYTINIQPVIPITLNKNWNLISRTVLPFAQQSNTTGPGEVTTGLADTLQSFFFSPAEPSKKLGLIWGVGPAILIPTGTNTYFGGEKWAMGPTIVVLKQTGPWTYGLLANQLWQLGGKGTPGEPTVINSMFLQPFLARAYKGGFSWTLNTEYTQNWAADFSLGSINFTVNQIFPVFGQLVQVAFGPKYFYGSAAVRARWGVRLNLVFLFPKK